MVLWLILIGLTAFITGASLVAMPSMIAIQLDLFGAHFLPHFIWVYLLLYITGIVCLKTKRAPLLYRSAFVASFFALVFPSLVLNFGVEKIKLSDHPSHKSIKLFEAAYPVRYVSYSSSSEGDCLLVRKQDYSHDMEIFIKELVQKQAKNE